MKGSSSLGCILLQKKMVSLSYLKERDKCSENEEKTKGKVGESVQMKYMRLVDSQQLQYDEQQFQIVRLLSKLQQRTDETPNNDNIKLENIIPEHTDSPNEDRHPDVQSMVPRGLYIHGDVGTGKTMMMDLLYDSCNASKKRVHFHKFMLDVHKIIHEYKQDLLKKYGREKNVNLDPSRDPILHCASVIRKSAQLLCFDEFQVTDIADAIIMTKLFGELWRQGAILVATSNRHPSMLYHGGLNREYFLPFIEELQYRCVVRRLGTSIDYRKLMSSTKDNSYITPINENTSKQLYSMFLSDSSAQSEPQFVSIPVMMGRTMRVLARDRVCHIHFKDLCEEYRGAADYAALAKHMDVVYLEGVPTLSVLVHDKARRFITLIDELYDAGNQLYWTSDAEPEQMFKFLTPAQLNEADFGTDHSWANLDQVRGERGAYVKEPYTTPEDGHSSPHPSKFEKDGATFSMRFKEASQSTEMAFKENPEDSTCEEREVRLLEGELASIQELSFAFKRAASRLIELSSSNKRKNNKNT